MQTEGNFTLQYEYGIFNSSPSMWPDPQRAALVLKIHLSIPEAVRDADRINARREYLGVLDTRGPVYIKVRRVYYYDWQTMESHQGELRREELREYWVKNGKDNRGGRS